MEQLIERVNKLAVPAKAGLIAGILLVLVAGNYFLLVADVEARLTAIAQEQQVQDSLLVEKQAIAENLNEKRREMDALDERFQEALLQLPEKKDIEELLSQLSEVGKKSGLELSRITPGNETPSGIYSRIPIAVSVSGNYHEIAMFLQEVANLRRIVNVTDPKLGTPSTRGDKVMLNSEFVATTFRFIDVKKEEAKKGAKP